MKMNSNSMEHVQKQENQEWGVARLKFYNL